MVSELDTVGESVLNKLHETADKNLKFFHGHSLMNPCEFGWEYEDDDYVYQIKTTMRRKEKHTCQDCTYNIQGKCKYDYDIVNDVKHYCHMYTTDKSCNDCKNYIYLNSDEYCCEKDFDKIYEYLYEDNWNSSGKCPYWELDI